MAGAMSESLAVVTNTTSGTIILDNNESTVAVVNIGTRGLEGKEGKAGESGDLHFKFTQGFASEKWEIEHNLGKYPSVFVQDSAHETVDGLVEYVNTNELIVTFSAAFSGVAYLN